MPQFDPSFFSKWGEQAAKNFLTQNTSLNEGIAKIASEQDLNPTQIKRVCETANLSTYKTLFFNNKEKAMDFDIATPEKVAESLQDVEIETPQADYLSQPSFQKTASTADINRAFNFESISNSPEIQERVKVAEKLHRQIGEAENELKMQIQTDEIKKSAAEDNIYNIVKQMVLSGESFKKVASVAVNQSSHDIKPLMSDVYDRLRKEGVFGVMEKIAKYPATVVETAAGSDQGVVENGAPRIINTNHPLVQEVNTLGEAADSIDRKRRATRLLKDKANVLKGKIQDLTESEQRDKYIKETLGEDGKPTAPYESAVHSPG